jgi:Zn-dependent peptidase ImmA (M78 family)
MVANVEVKPALLEWARKRAFLSTEALADSLSVSVGAVARWEQTGVLSLSRLEKVSQKTRTPVGYFFLEQPPAESLPVTDFRTLGATTPRQPSPDLLEMLYICERRQAWYREYLLFEEAEALPPVTRASTRSDPVETAESIRSAIGWDSRARSAFVYWDDALRDLVRRIEDAGVLVMRSGIVGSNTHRHLDVEEFRGFALSDDYAPLIFVNSRDARAAQMFTLAHELVHIWLGESGVSDAHVSSRNSSERFCNAVAGEVLVPIGEFRANWNNAAGTWSEARRLARLFKVSQLVVLIRALEASVIAREEFDQLYPQAAAIGKASTTSDGGDFYKTQGARLGARFKEAVVISTLEGRTGYTEAFRLLGIRSESTFDTMARQLGVTG